MKIALFLLIIAGLGSLGAASMMPEISWFNFQEIEVIEGKAEISGDFTCECVDMQGNVALCTSDMNVLPNDFCTACAVSGSDCSDDPPNTPGPYINSATMCNVDTTCP